ncbi:MAG: NAD-dependent succinate-semialdehyde dehydrogenase [Deltaproteobacteria bacterium]|nr:NAD-dependent succinate-semialdehyde dehydrogenase [Deltaproteobacteria bacterium]
MTYRTLNPATGELVQTYPEVDWSEIQIVAEESQQAFFKWRETPFQTRRDLFLKVAEKLSAHKPEFASLMTQEMGKTIVESEKEVEKCVWGCNFYAEQAEGFLKPQRIVSDASRSYVRFDPLGVILIIMPWNFPFWQVFRCAVPALMAGNTVILKHAPNVPGCAVTIERLFNEVGFPKGVFQSIFCDSETVARLIESPVIAGVSLTGSSRAGSSVAATAGRAIKKVVLELGGSDPFIVLPDADLAKCVPMALYSRMLNCGQSYIAAKRFILTKRIAKEFEEGFLKAVEAQRVGDPTMRETNIGPLAREDLLQNLSRQVDESKKRGAVCLRGGERLSRKGYFYLPTVLKEVQPGMAAFDEETFGPVASLIVAQDEEEAMEFANRTPYGLGASLWTKNLEKAERLAAKIDAGSVFINGTTKSDPRLPFGGTKRSGFGRELSSFGIQEFTNLKTVWIA